LVTTALGKSVGLITTPPKKEWYTRLITTALGKCLLVARGIGKYTPLVNYLQGTSNR
jgi:hypothetical protein